MVSYCRCMCFFPLCRLMCPWFSSDLSLPPAVVMDGGVRQMNPKHLCAKASGFIRRLLKKTASLFFPGKLLNDKVSWNMARCVRAWKMEKWWTTGQKNSGKTSCRGDGNSCKSGSGTGQEMRRGRNHRSKRVYAPCLFSALLCAQVSAEVKESAALI